MKKILFPTDFSSCSERALQFVIKTAKAFDCKVVVLHIRSTSLMDLNVPEAEAEKALLQQLERVRESLRAIGTQLENENISGETLITEGNIASVIAREAEKIIPFMIIMGTNGAGGIAGKLLGSNAESTIAKTQYSVLLIPGNASFRSLNNMLFAVDLQPNELVSLHQLTHLADKFDADVRAVHITKKITEEVQEALSGFKQKANNLIDYSRLYFTLHEHQSITEGIPEYAETIKADLIALQKREVSFFKKLFGNSVTAALALGSKTPLLIYP